MKKGHVYTCDEPGCKAKATVPTGTAAPLGWTFRIEGYEWHDLCPKCRKNYGL